MTAPRSGALRRTDGEWFPIRRRNWVLECCDCGSTHRLNFRIRRGRLYGQAFRITRRVARGLIP